MIVQPIPSWSDVPAGIGKQPTRASSELFTKLASLPRPQSQPHTLRAKGQDVGTLVFRVLLAAELEAVIRGAHKATIESVGEEAKGSIAYEEVYLEQKALHLLAFACRQTADPQFPTFFNALDVRENLTDDEVAVVLSAYSIFRRESGPIVSEVPPEECAAWLDLVSKNKSRVHLARHSAEALTDLIMYAVEKMAQKHAETEAAKPDGSVAPVLETPKAE